MPIANCFVIMSFAKKYWANYEDGIKKPIEKLGLRCNRYDELRIPGEIYAGIIAQIRTSFIVVADLTGAPLNCYYELGFAHALGWKNNVILLRKAGTKAPFNVIGYNIIKYRSAENLATKLVRVIRRSLLSTEGTVHPDDTCRGQYGSKAFTTDRLLTARFDRGYPDEDGDMVYDIQVQVEQLAEAPPLTDKVEFFLHRSYGTRPKVVKARNGKASYTVLAAGGAFTIGALADDSKTRLEFDLGKLPGAADSFYNPSLQRGSRRSSSRRGRPVPPPPPTAPVPP